MVWGWPISDGYAEPGAVQSANLIAAQTVPQSAHEAPPAASLSDPGLHSHQRWVCVLVPLGDPLSVTKLGGPRTVSDHRSTFVYRDPLSCLI